MIPRQLHRTALRSLSKTTPRALSHFGRHDVSKQMKIAERSPQHQSRLFASGVSLQESGILDERNLLKFETLHELQLHSNIAFADNPIFGTYTDEGGDPRFEYITYKEFGEKVNLCRTVLSNLGKD